MRCGAVQAGVRTGLHLTLERCPSLPAGSVPFKLCPGPGTSFPRPHPGGGLEVVAPAGATLRECVKLAAAAAAIEFPCHLCTTVMMGDKGTALNDMDSPLGKQGVHPNAMLMLEAGDIVPKGYCDIKVSWLRRRYTGCPSIEGALAEFAGDLVRGIAANVVAVMARPGSAEAIASDVAKGLGITSVQDCVDATDLRVDSRIRSVGVCRVPLKASAHALLAEIGLSLPIAALPGFGPDWAEHVTAREVKSCRLSRVLCSTSTDSKLMPKAVQT